MDQIKQYREVGSFDVLNAPLNPIGAFNAEEFKKIARQMLDNGSRHVIVDLSGLDFLYSDAFNAFLVIRGELNAVQGSLGIVNCGDSVFQTLVNAGIDKQLHIYIDESSLMEASAAMLGRDAKANSVAKEQSTQSTSSSAQVQSKGNIHEPQSARSNNSGNSPHSGHSGSSQSRHWFIESENKLDDFELDDFSLDQEEDTKSGSKIGIILFILFLLAAAGAGGWYYFTQMAK
jgi:anti-anti-sigma factor